MARSYGALKTQIWEPGSDFRRLEPMEQWCYAMLISQPQINNLGVLPYTPEKWWRLAAGLTPETVAGLVLQLEQDHYVIVDRDTTELLIRTFVKHDRVWKQPRLVTNARRLIRQVESATIRNYLTTRHPWLTNDLTKDQIEQYEETYKTPNETPILTPHERASTTHAPAGPGQGVGGTTHASSPKSSKAAASNEPPLTQQLGNEFPARDAQPESLPAALDELLNRLGVGGGLRVAALQEPVRALACAQAALARGDRNPGGLFRTLLESGETPAVMAPTRPRVAPCASCGVGGGRHLVDCDSLKAVA